MTGPIVELKRPSKNARIPQMPGWRGSGLLESEMTLPDLPKALTWDSAQYCRFGDNRTRPAAELLARVPLQQMETVVDLGCGPGNSTMLLAYRWPMAKIIGVDNSSEMLDDARKRLPTITFELRDIATWAPVGPLDLVFSNAALQWLPNHDALLPRLLRHLRPGGFLALQMPANYDAPSHTAMNEIANHSRWRKWLGHVPDAAPTASAERYYDLLSLLARHVDLWQTSYFHEMSSLNDIVEWVKGAGLRPYLALLPEEERSAYLECYREMISKSYPQRENGQVLFAFRRLFIVAER
jgi:trans-aconitate 2-methyltransferase